MRFNWHYVVWYQNFVSLIVSLLAPLVMLVYWNSNTLGVIRRRRRLRNRPYLHSPNSAVGQANASMDLGNQNVLLPEAAAVLLNYGTNVPAPRQDSTSEQGIT